MESADGRSAFGVDHGWVSKATRKQDHHQATGSAIAGAGGTVAATGLAGGGVPGVKSDRLLADVGAASGRRKKASALARAYRGGEFGYRTNAHRTFSNFSLGGQRSGESRAAHFEHGHKAGKLAAEEKVIRHLRTGRRASAAALIGGGAATVYGVRRAQGKKTFGKAERDKRGVSASGAAVGVGGATAGLSYGGEKLMEQQGRKWNKRAVQSLSEAKRIAPKTGGHKVITDPKRIKNAKIPGIVPEVSSQKIRNDKSLMAGKSKAQAEAVGRLRGGAAQHSYFAQTYGQGAKLIRRARGPALVGAGIGAGGLLAAHHRKQVSKGVSRGLRLVAAKHPGTLSSSRRIMYAQERLAANKFGRQAQRESYLFDPRGAGQRARQRSRTVV